MNALLALAKEKKLQKERTTAAMAGGQGAQIHPNSDEDTACQGIVGSLHGPCIQSKSTTTSSTSSRVLAAAPHPHRIFVPKNTAGAQSSSKLQDGRGMCMNM